MIHLWHDIPLGKAAPKQVHAVIEIPMGSRCKYELDKHTGIIKVDRIIASAVYYPGNYGFLPQTLGADGDPLDVLVVSQIAFHPGIFLETVPIGGVHMIDGHDVDDKIICVPSNDPKFREITELHQLPKNTRAEIEEFFRVYKNLEGKKVHIKGSFGRAVAYTIITKAIAQYKKRAPRF
jgi:inorganic pyrophosphatase